ncbi:MAG: PspC domain-containing protein [Bacteroidales bacterium]
MAHKRFYRSTGDKKIGGVCGGLADYLDVDPTIVRVIFAVCILGYCIGLLIYLIIWLIAPER